MPEPTAQGTFASTPLPHVLIHALNERLTGTFELSGRNFPAGTFLVIDGHPAKARTMVDHYLVRVMQEVGIMTEGQVNNWLPRLLMSEELHGRALVRKKVLTPEQVDLGLRAQLVRQMQTIVELPPETVFRYYDEVDSLAGYGGDSEIRLDPFPFIWSSLRRQPPWGQVRPALERVSGSAIRMKQDAEPSRFAFDKAERAIVSLLRRKPWMLDELLVASSQSNNVVQLVAYCLMLTRQVDLVDASEAASPLGPAIPSEVPPPLEPEATPAPVAVAPARPAPSPRPPEAVARESPDSGGTPPTPAPVSGGQPSAIETPHVAQPPPSAEREPSSKVPTPRAEVPVKPPSAPITVAADRVPYAPKKTPFATEAPPTPRVDVEAQYDRTTAAPPPNLEEPGYDVAPKAAAAPPAKPSEPQAGVHTHKTMQSMGAVSEAEVNAYIASQEAAAKARAEAEAKARASAGDRPGVPAPRPSAPSMLAAMRRPLPPPPFKPLAHGAPPPSLRIPGAPQPAPFAQIAPAPAAADARRAVEESASGSPSQDVTVAGTLDLSAMDETETTAVSGTSKAIAGAELTASRLTVKGAIDITDKAEPAARPGAIAPLVTRKTLEVAVDRALIEATAGAASQRINVEVVPTPRPGPPPPPAPPKPALELDAPWDDGWEDVEPPAGKGE